MSITTFLNRFDSYILNPLILLMFALATLYFVYGVIRFLSVDAGDKGNTRIEARNAIMWGIVGMVVMFSVYGLISIILSSFGITGGDLGPDAGQYIRFY